MSNVTELHPMKLTEEGEIDWTHEPVPDMERAVRNKILEGWLAGNPTTAQMQFTLAMLQVPGPLDEAREMASDSLRAEAIYNDRTKEETLAENAAKLEAVLRKVRSGAPEQLFRTPQSAFRLGTLSTRNSKKVRPRASACHTIKPCPDTRKRSRSSAICRPPIRFS